MTQGRRVLFPLVAALASLGVALPVHEEPPPPPRPPPDPERIRAVIAGTDEGDRVAREAVRQRLEARPLRDLPLYRGPARPPASRCPDDCGTECPHHGKRNAKLLRRAARTRQAQSVLVWVCDSCGMVARAYRRGVGDEASCPHPRCEHFATVHRVPGEIGGHLPRAPGAWNGRP